VDDILISEAHTTIAKYTLHAELNEGLKDALVSTSKSVVRNALNLAEDSEMENDLVVAVQEKLRNMEAHSQSQSPAGGGVGGSRLSMASQRASIGGEHIVSVEDADTVRAKRNELASNSRFMHKNYPALRSADNFARGSIFQKSAVKVSFLMFSKENIPKSLTEMKFPDHNKQADQVSIYVYIFICVYMNLYVILYKCNVCCAYYHLSFICVNFYL